MHGMVRAKDWDGGERRERKADRQEGSDSRKAKSNDVYLALKEKNRAGGGKYGFWHRGWWVRDTKERALSHSRWAVSLSFLETLSFSFSLQHPLCGSSFRLLFLSVSSVSFVVSLSFSIFLHSLILISPSVISIATSPSLRLFLSSFSLVPVLVNWNSRVLASVHLELLRS